MAKGKKSRPETKVSTNEQQTPAGKPDAPEPKRKKGSRAQDIEGEKAEVQGRHEEEELAPEVKRKLERKLKKERKKEAKKLQREGGESLEEEKPPQSSACDLALEYLTGWSKKRKEWRFQKTRQTWLLQHMYDCDKISAKHFTQLLGYLDGLKGNARELTIQKAEALIKETDASDDSTEDSTAKIERMRQVLQLLS